MPRDGYDNDRHGFDSNARGRIFENGTDAYFAQNQRNGYERAREVMTSLGPRRIDKSKVGKDGRLLSVEDKSGRVDSKHDAREFAKDRELIERGVIGHHTIRTVEGEKISKEAREFIDGMKRDFPDRFIHQVVSREQARAIWALGLQREKNARQLELVSQNALRRRQRAAERLQRIREAAERLRERERPQRERGHRHQRAAERLPKVREAAERLRERERQDRERDERQLGARERLLLMRETTERIRMPAPKSRDERRREEREVPGGDLVRDVAELREVREYAEKVREVREAADVAERQRHAEAAKATERERQEREAVERELRERAAAERDRKEREIADALLRARLPPDVTDLMLEGRPTPGLHSPHREPPSPGSTRGGRSELARSRERGREGRGRER